MSLSQHDRHALAQIEDELAGDDPRFAARLSAFARLADDGAMPERERIREPRRPVAGVMLRGLRAAVRPGARLYWFAMALAAAVTLAVMCAALVSGNTGTKDACASWQGLVCTRQAAPSAPAHAPAGGKVGTASPSP